MRFIVIAVAKDQEDEDDLVVIMDGRNQPIVVLDVEYRDGLAAADPNLIDRKSTRLNSSHLVISYAVFCLKKKKKRICAPSRGTQPHASGTAGPTRHNT